MALILTGGCVNFGFRTGLAQKLLQLFLRVVDETTDRCTRRNRSNTSAWFGLMSHDLVRLLVDGRAESDRRWPLGGRPRA